MQAYHPMTDCSRAVQIASVQTLARRAIPPSDLVLVDECHRQFNFVTRWLASPEMANVPVIGLSATPWSRGLGKVYDDLVVSARIRELIDLGFLSDYRVFAPSHPDLTGFEPWPGISTRASSRRRCRSRRLSPTSSRPGSGLARTDRPRLRRRSRTRPRAPQEFEVRRIATAYIDAFTESAERKTIFGQFSDGAMRVIVSVATLTTGIDLDVRCIVLARPTKSEMLFVQIAGRGLRTAEGKDHCLILDHSDTTLRLGFPIKSIATRSMTAPAQVIAVRQEREEPKPKECPACNFLKPARVHKCPTCGFAPERQSERPDRRW